MNAQSNLPEKRRANLFSFESPEMMVDAATKISRTLTDIIEGADLYVDIKGKKYVTVEGWTTLGFLVGVFSVIEETERIEREPHSGRKKPEVIYRARATARRSDGTVIGAAEMLCSSYEKNWYGRDEYAIQSMAETRAVSKALRMPLGWIVSLAGYAPTPAEETDILRNKRNEANNGPKRNRETKRYSNTLKPERVEDTIDAEIVEDELSDEEIEELKKTPALLGVIEILEKQDLPITRENIREVIMKRNLSAEYREKLLNMIE